METKWYEWVFSGVGTEIISFLLAFGVGYFWYCRNKQKQKAGHNAKQYQEYDGDGVEQTQEARDNAEQIQVGGKNVR